MNATDPAAAARIWQDNLDEAERLAKAATTADGVAAAAAYVRYAEAMLAAAERAQVAQLRTWQADRVPLRLHGACTVRVVVGVRACGPRWACPRHEDAGRECVAVVDVAEPHDTRFRISNVHLLPGELTPAYDSKETNR